MGLRGRRWEIKVGSRFAANKSFSLQQPRSAHQSQRSGPRQQMGRETLMVTRVKSNLAFLDSASRLLVDSCPAVSAHLQQELTDEAFATKTALADSRKHEACLSCGYLATPENSTTQLVRDVESARAKGSRMPPEGQQRKLLVTTCAKCGNRSRTTVTPAPAVNKRTNRPSDGRESKADESHTKISRKKKQSLRKKEQNLRTMLRDQRYPTRGAPAAKFGLSLMDLMKSDAS
jgi:hypothetical protein